MEILNWLIQDADEANGILVEDVSTDIKHPDRDLWAVFHYVVFKQLIEYGFLKRDEFEEAVK